MKSIISYLILILLSCLTMANEFEELDLKELSDDKAFQIIKENVSSYDKNQKSVLARDIFTSKRRILFLKVLSLPEIPLFREFDKAPKSNYKHQLALDILRDDSQWTIPLVTGKSGVGSPYHRSLILCDSVINNFFKEGEINWDGPLTKRRRLAIALQFENVLVNDHKFTPMKVLEKAIIPSMNLNAPTKNGLIDKKLTTQDNHKHGKVENVHAETGDRNNLKETTTNPVTGSKGDAKTFNHPESEEHRTKKVDKGNRLPWIVGGFLMLSIAGFFFIKGKK